jgi:hypothetical protein
LSVSYTWATADYYIIQVGILNLPAAQTDGDGWKTRITLNIAGGATLDEAWLFRMDGNLTYVDCGTSPTSTHLVVQAPSVDVENGRILRGNSDGILRAATSSLFASQIHTLHPGVTPVFVVASGSSTPTLEAEYYPRWHTTAAS